jgi:hypothetical protein
MDLNARRAIRPRGPYRRVCVKNESVHMKANGVNPVRTASDGVHDASVCGIDATSMRAVVRASSATPAIRVFI